MFFLKALPTAEMIGRYTDRFPEVDPDVVADRLRALRDASVHLRELEAYFSDHGLSILRFLILIVIDREPELGGLTGNDIAERIDVSRPVLSRTLQSLNHEGLIEITRDPGDRRAKRIRLTRAGAEKLAAVMPGYYQHLHLQVGRSPDGESPQPSPKC